MVSFRARRAVLVLVFLAAPLAPVAAQTPASFFAGKTITVTIGFGPGGSYDFYGHLVARHLGRFIPGRPTLVAENMRGPAPSRPPTICSMSHRRTARRSAS